MNRILTMVTVLVLTTGCSQAADDPRVVPAVSVPPNPPTASTTASGLASGSTAPSSTAPTPSFEPLPDDPELRHIVELRRSLGLRSDLAYIAMVAADPAATTALLEIPLLPAEEAELIARQVNADVVAPVVRAYAELHTDEYAGIYIDHESGGDVMTLWTGHLAEHGAAVRARLPARSRIAFRRVEFSERFLRGLQDQITAALAPPSDWLEAIPARLESIGVDVVANHAFVRVSSANPEAKRRIEAHFEVGRALVVESDGTGAALVPWGEVAGTVRTNAGQVPRAGDYLLLWHGPVGLQCGGGDIGYGLAPDGTFKLPCQEGEWAIDVAVPGEDGEWRTLGVGTVDVLANATVELDITVIDTP